MLAALRRLDDEGRLDAWVVTSLQVNDKIFGTHPLGQNLIDLREQYRSPHHRPDFVKIFLDGVPTSRTAAFLDPYLPDDEYGSGWRGTTTMTAEELTGWLLRVAEQGMSAKVHCTGDGSTRMLLDGVAAVRAAGYGAARFHLAHGQYVDDEDLPRLAELGVVADISPPLWFPSLIIDAICTCVPKERAERIHPNRALLDSGALLAGGSDWPVMPSPNPWFGIQGLVSRADPTGSYPGRLWPEQAVSVAEAIHAYTLGSARAMGLDDVAGSLSVGKSADFVVLDRDPFTCDTGDLAATVALETWFAGECVYRRESALQGV
jgi:predicted amidohydrolase YtcJ